MARTPHSAAAWKGFVKKEEIAQTNDSRVRPYQPEA